MMKTSIKQRISILLSVIMMITCICPMALAEEAVPNVESGSTITATSEATTYQGIEISSDNTAPLSNSETAYYTALANNIENSGSESLTVPTNDGYTVYSVQETGNAGEDTGNTVIQAVTYTNDDNAAVNVVSYDEVVLSSADSNTNSGSDNGATSSGEAAVNNESVAGNAEVTGSSEVAENEATTSTDNESAPSDANVMASTDPADSDGAGSDSTADTGAERDDENGANPESAGNNEESKPDKEENVNEGAVDSEKPASEENAEGTDSQNSNEENISNSQSGKAEVQANTKQEANAAGNDSANSGSNKTDNSTASAQKDLTAVAAKLEKAADNAHVDYTNIQRGNSFENSYRNTDSITLTAEELLTRINSDDSMAFEFAKSLGFGSDKQTIAKNLKTIIDEYKANKDTFEEPRFVINGVDIALDTTTEGVHLVENSDGTYRVSMEGGQEGYRTTINIDANASVTIVYDEKGQAKVERTVKTAKPTDFVITLDISASMNNYGRDNAMMSALRVLVDEILSDKRNTVSLVVFASNGAIVQLDIDSNGIVQQFSREDGITTETLFDANLVKPNGTVTDISLGDVTISQLEKIYSSGTLTAPETGLTQAINLLEAIRNNDNTGRNTGVVLFTDGAANKESSRRQTVRDELKIAEQYGATVVNVSIGDEKQVSRYERYLNPNSPNYYEPNNPILQSNVLYYNIPQLSDQELADRVSEIFEVVYEDIVTETTPLKTETITDGVLAAYGARLIQEIPAGFRVVRVNDGNSDVSYRIDGTDAEGNTTISFEIGNLISGHDMTLSYCVIPTKTDVDLGVTAYNQNSQTVLYSEPVNKIEEDEEGRKIEIIYSTEAPMAPHSEEVSADPTREETVTTIAVPGIKSNIRTSQATGRNSALSDEERRQAIERFENTMTTAGIDADIIRETIDYLNSTTDLRMRDVWLYLFTDDNLVDVRTVANGGVSSTNTDSNGDVYVEFDTITLPNDGQRAETVFHEFGHAIDLLVAKMNGHPRECYTASQQKYEDLVADVRESIGEQVDKELEKYFKKAGAILGLKISTEIVLGGFLGVADVFGQTKRDLEGINNADNIKEYIIELLINYNHSHWDANGNVITPGQYKTQLEDQYFGGTFVLPKKDLDRIINNIVKDFRNVTSDLVENNDMELYTQLISDVYGGVTNNELMDGNGHFPDTNGLATTNELEAFDSDYWYTHNANTESPILSRFTSESWAEYVSMTLMGESDANRIMNRFLNHYNAEGIKNEMYDFLYGTTN